MTIKNLHTPVNYETSLSNFIAELEGSSSSPYFDTKGIITVGIGINIDDLANRNYVLRAMGIANPNAINTAWTAHDMATIRAMPQANSAQLAEKNSALSNYLNGILGSGSSFTMTDAVIQSTFLHFATVHTTPIEAYIVDPSLEKIALVSAHYNGVFGAGLKGALEMADTYEARAEAWYQIRYKHQNELHERRYMEAAIFGLYGNNVALGDTVDQASAIYRMYTKHGRQGTGSGVDMVKYDTQFAISLANAENRLNTAGFDSVHIHSLREELRPAANALVLHYIADPGIIGTPEFPDFIAFDPLNIQVAFDANIVNGESTTTRTGSNHDLLIGRENQADTLNGLGGDDVLIGLSGDDSLNGGDGKDLFVGGGGADKHDGGNNEDTISYLLSPSAVTVNLQANIGQGGYAEGDTFANIENITGSPYADTLTGNSQSNTLIGLDGNDTITGGGGNDFLIGNAGRDILNGGEGNDRLIGGAENDTLDGGAGFDSAVYANPINDYDIFITSDNVTVTVKAKGGAILDGEDTLYNIEQLQFSDALVSLPKLNIALMSSGFEDVLHELQVAFNEQVLQGQGLSNSAANTSTARLSASSALSAATTNDNAGLPFFGDILVNTFAGHFIEDFGKEIIDYFTGQFVDELVPAEEIQSALFSVFNPLGILKDTNSDGAITTDDVVYTRTGNIFQFNFDLGGRNTFAVDLPPQIGLPQLGLQLGDNAQAGVNLDYTFDFGFGVDADTGQFFFDTSPDQDLSISFTPTLTELTATIGFLQVDATDLGTNLQFSINLDDGNDNHLTLDELDNLTFTPEGTADIDLNLLSSISGQAALPKIGTDLNLHWDFIEGGLAPELSFDNTTVYLGSFLTNFVKPIIEPIQQIVQPIQQTISFLTEPIGLLRDLNLGGANHDLLGLAKQFSPGNPTLQNVTKAIEAIQFVGDLANLVNSISGTEDIGINLGTVDLANFNLLSGDSINSATLIAPEQSLAQLEQDFQSKIDQIQNPDTASQFQSFFDDKGSIGDFRIAFPILEDPKSAIGLLTGQNVNFFTFDLPEFDFKAGISGSFVIPPVPIIKVGFAGEVGANLRLGFGYDSSGIQKWANQGFNPNNTADIFDGFFINDHRQGGVDLPELTVYGMLNAYAGIDIFFAEGRVEGGVKATVYVDLEDVGEDGKNLGYSDGAIHPSEFISILKDDIGCLFEIGGQLDAYLGYYARLGWPPFGAEWRGDLARTTLADFGIETCPDKQPILAERLGDGTLALNIGSRASERKFFNIQDHNEIFVLEGGNQAGNETVRVSALGYRQNYGSIQKIIAYAGEADDVINLASIAVALEFYGGNGNDILNGGSNSDVLNGDGGDDQLYSDGGNDTVSGGAGRDLIYAGDGDDNVSGGDDDDTLSGEGGADIIKGDAGNDYLSGGAGSDQLFGDSDNLQAGNDTLLGGDGNDALFGFAGNDVLIGDAGNDGLYGETGDDELLGEIGDDLLKGEAGNDKISGGEGVDTVSYDNSPNGVVVNIDEGQAYSHAGGSLDLEPVFSIAAATAADGFGSLDSFAFTTTRYIYDEASQQAILQTIILAGNLENISGSQFNDILIGNSIDNTIKASGGDDLLIGNAGNDSLYGGDGIDTVSYRRDPGAVNVNLAMNQATDGFSGTDVIIGIENVAGSAFDDRVTGDGNANKIAAGDGNDLVAAGGSDDYLYGENGDDTVVGEAGNDLIDGGEAIDTVSYYNSPNGVIVNIDETNSYHNAGGYRHETIVSGQAIFTDTEPAFTINPGTALDGFGNSDTLKHLENIIGSEHDDILIGNELINSIQGLGGNDLLIGNANNDAFLDGGEGIDTVSYRRDPGTVNVNLEQHKASDGFGGQDQIVNFENVIGSAFDDKITGNDQQNTIIAGAGNDRVEARNGDDILFGEQGRDSLFGEAGHDFLVDTLFKVKLISLIFDYSADAGIT